MRCDTIDDSSYRLNFDLGHAEEQIPSPPLKEHVNLKLEKLQSVAANCCKMWKI
jgi:hypothetical protein